MPVVGSPAVTAAAMRAAAALIEAARAGGVSITCDDGLIGIQVSRHQTPGLTARMATLSALAAVLGGQVLRQDHPAGRSSWLTVHGIAGGIPVRIYTELTEPEISIHGEGEALAMGGHGHPAPGGRDGRQDGSRPVSRP